MRPGACRQQVPPLLPPPPPGGVPGAGPPQPSAGRGEGRQRVPPSRRRIPPLLRARLRLPLLPPPRIPEPPDSLAASAAGGGRLHPPSPPLAVATARQHRPHLIEGPSPLGHAPSPPSLWPRSLALTGVPPIGPRLVSFGFPLGPAALVSKGSKLRLLRRFSLAGERGMTRETAEGGATGWAGPRGAARGAGGLLR